MFFVGFFASFERSNDANIVITSINTVEEDISDGGGRHKFGAKDLVVANFSINFVGLFRYSRIRVQTHNKNINMGFDRPVFLRRHTIAHTLHSKFYRGMCQ